MVEVVTFASTLTDTCKHRQAAVRFGNVVDQLKHVNGFAHTGTTEQADLTAFGKGAHKVNHLDTGFKQFNRGRQLVELGRVLVNTTGFFRFNWTTLVDRAAQNVHNASQCRLADRHGDGCAGVGYGHATTKTVGRTHGDGANHAVAQLLLNFKG